VRVTADGVAVGAPEETVADAGVAEEGDCDEEDKGADRARLPFQEKSSQVQHHEHHVVVQQGRVNWFRQQQHWY